jgi:BioD-like phosphotransacetylase family protein
MNTTTPRVFIAATRQNDGKTTTSLGLIAALQKYFPRIGYIKPVGQRFVEIEEQKIDEDTVLMDAVYPPQLSAGGHEPHRRRAGFHAQISPVLQQRGARQKNQKAFDRVAWEKDFVLCEGSGHAGVGSVFDLSNAQVAKILGARSSSFPRAASANRLTKLRSTRRCLKRKASKSSASSSTKCWRKKFRIRSPISSGSGLKRKGLDLLGVLPHEQLLSNPTVDLIREELHAELLNSPPTLHTLVDDVVVGAMGAQNAMQFFKRGVLLITPGDREDILLAAGAMTIRRAPKKWPASS